MSTTTLSVLIFIGIMIASAIVAFGGFYLFLYINQVSENKQRLEHGYRTQNKLYKCNHCKKLSREYQLRLNQSLNNLRYNEHCVHCGVISQLDDVEKEDSWMKTHPDCPHITFKQYKGLVKTMKEVNRSKMEIEETKRFEEYNSLKVDSKWINNLTKDLEKIKQENTL